MELFISITLFVAYFISLYFVVFWFLVFLDDGLAEEKQVKPTVLPFVTIVIPAFNEIMRKDTGEARNIIAKTIDITLSIDYPQELFEVIIVNDGSTDGTRDAIREVIALHPGRNITFIDYKVNRGKWYAMNRALKVAKGEFFVSMDGDSLLPRSILRKLIPYFADDSVGCVMPNMKVIAPTNFIERLQQYEYTINMFYKKLMSKLDCVHVAPGPFSVFRTSVIREVGGYRHGHNTEDLEITMRLQKSHYKVVQVMTVDVYTKVPSNLKTWFRQRNRWLRGSTVNAITTHRALLFSKEHGDFGFIQMPAILAGGLIALIFMTTGIYYFFKPYVMYFAKMRLVDFDFTTMLRDITPHWYLLDVQMLNVIIFAFTFVLGLFFLIRSHQRDKRPLLQHGVMPLIAFMFLYFFLIGMVWVNVSYDMVRKRSYKW